MTESSMVQLHPRFGACLASASTDHGRAGLAGESAAGPCPHGPRPAVPAVWPGRGQCARKMNPPRLQRHARRRHPTQSIDSSPEEGRIVGSRQAGIACGLADRDRRRARLPPGSRLCQPALPAVASVPCTAQTFQQPAAVARIAGGEHSPPRGGFLGLVLCFLFGAVRLYGGSDDGS